MDKSILIEQINEVAEPLCRAENVELVQIECVSSNREKIIRLYLDKPGGITIEDCVYVSRQLGDLIDVHIDNIGSYRLEVSSPGPKRPLNTKADFHRFKGERVKIETDGTAGDPQKFTGTLEAVNDDSVVIDVDGKRMEISDNTICKARLAGR